MTLNKRDEGRKDYLETGDFLLPLIDRFLIFFIFFTRNKFLFSACASPDSDERPFRNDAGRARQLLLRCARPSDHRAARARTHYRAMPFLARSVKRVADSSGQRQFMLVLFCFLVELRAREISPVHVKTE